MGKFDRIVGKFGRENVWRIDYMYFRAFGEEKFGKLINQPKGLLILSTNLDGFSLANHGQFAKFTKLSPTNIPSIW